jgi:membrane dipeptidase
MVKFKNALASMDQQLAHNGMKRSLNMTDLRAAHKKRQPTVIQSIEGAHFLEGHPERIGEAYDRGLRHFGLLHDSDASVPLGDVYTNPAQWGGLTRFGEDVIRECNRLGILVDLAHASAETVIAALKVAAHPVIVSHTGLDTRLGQNPSMARMMRPRLISKEQAPGGPGGGQNGVRIGERTNLAWQDQKVGFYYAVVDAMLKTGFTADEIGKVGGGNFCRVFDAATTGH